jgi:hypothetical protein
MKRIAARILLPLALTTLNLSAVELRPRETALAEVKRIYVDQLGGGKTSDQLRDMLISALQGCGLFVLTENPDRADAILKGSGDDQVFTEDHISSDSIGVHANAGDSSSSRALNAGTSSSNSHGIGVSDSESSRVQERRHEATASVRLVAKDGDVIWSTTQESNGAKFRSALADVADKVMKQLADQTRRVREMAASQRSEAYASASNPKP